MPKRTDIHKVLITRHFFNAFLSNYMHFYVLYRVILWYNDCIKVDSYETCC